MPKLQKKSDAASLTTEEQKALQNQKDNDAKESAQTDRMDAFLALIKDRFKMDSEYVVTGFNDKGKNITIQIQNVDFVIAVKARNAERLSLPVTV